MTSDTESSPNEDLFISDYLKVILRKWWVVALVFILIVAASAFYAIGLPDTYHARTKLLIVAPVSERLIASRTDTDDRLPINPFLGTNLSVETLSELGTANDLYRQIITELDLKDTGTGTPWAVERLASQISVNVETAGTGPSQTILPLLSMTIRGQNPELLKLIADAWANTFVAQNSRLFATEAARSYDFVISQYEDTQASLLAKEEEKLTFQRDASLPVLESQFRVLNSSYEEFIRQLQDKRSDLIEAEARLDSTRESLMNESEVVNLEKTIPSEVLILLLANSQGSISESSIPNLVSREQEINEFYFELRRELALHQADVDALTSDVTYLESETGRLKDEINSLSIEIASAKLNISRLDREIGILGNNFTRLGQSVQETQIARQEQAGFIQIVESAVAPTVPVGPDRRQIVLIAAVLGIVLGITAAFVVHYLQSGTQSSSPREGQPSHT